MSLPFLASTYAQFAPEGTDAQSVIDSAVDQLRERHADVDRYLPAMEFLSTKVFTDHHSLPLVAYIEVLYCAVKHGDFSREWRKQLRAQAVHGALAGPIAAHVN